MASALWTYTDKPWPKLPTKTAPQWATFIAGRAPEFKMHTNLGHAKNAINGSGHGICYRWLEDQWLPVAVVDRVLCINLFGNKDVASIANPPEFFVHGFTPGEIIHQYVIQEVP